MAPDKFSRIVEFQIVIIEMEIVQISSFPDAVCRHDRTAVDAEAFSVYALLLQHFFIVIEKRLETGKSF